MQAESMYDVMPGILYSLTSFYIAQVCHGNSFEVLDAKELVLVDSSSTSGDPTKVGVRTWTLLYDTLSFSSGFS